MDVTRSAHILVVDDSAVARHALATTLRSDGFAVAEATSTGEARQAIARSRADEVDLILLDLDLPDGTGIEVCSYIKQREGWADVPVILVTSSDDQEDLTDAFAAGATDYITKPPREVELRARIRAALRLKQEMARRKARERELEDVNRLLVEQAGELTAARAALLDLNRTLEERVEAQVDEILRRAREIEALNAQLRIQVQERSRELAEALRQVTEPPSRSLPADGAVLAGRVRLIARLGSGGMGHVYRAEDLLTRSEVAVKLLDRSLYGGRRDLHRFIHEAAAAAAIEHPAIVKTLHIDITETGQPFQIMELVEGVTLKTLLAGGALPLDRVLRIGWTVADALAAAHEAGVVHRDIKPGNLMVCHEGPGVRVLDFGISKTLASTTRVTWTGTGGVLGTPAYMAPEQFDDSSEITPASDIYSLGVVLFEMAAGTRPAWHGVAAPAPPAPVAPVSARQRQLPRGMSDVINRCLDRDPARRPPAAQVSAQLAACLRAGEVRASAVVPASASRVAEACS